MTRATSTAVPRQRAALVGLQLAGEDEATLAASLAELGRLVDTLGYEVVATVTQRRASPCPRTAIGAGKLEELIALTAGPGLAAINHRRPPKSKKADDDDDGDGDTGEDESDSHGATEASAGERKVDVLVFDQELTPTQLRNLERATGVEALDRTGVIVEIFHRHAKTREARLQVEIARLRYLSPRLQMLQAEKGFRERQGGGMGGRGAGESALELDRRRIRDRIAALTRELEEIHRDQSGRRERRRDQARVALVGYTNAGKSSLMRALTGSEVLVADKLFATLDTTIRALHPETTPRVLVSDTVGFIDKLPHDLVASFRSTLDEAGEAGLLLYVVDASDPGFRAQLAVTRRVLAEIDVGDTPSLLVLNKIDRLGAEPQAALRSEFPDAVLMSALARDDVRRLRERIVDFFERDMEEGVIHVPYAQGALLGEIRRSARVLTETAGDDGLTLRLRAPAETLARLAKLAAAPA